MTSARSFVKIQLLHVFSAASSKDVPTAFIVQYSSSLSCGCFESMSSPHIESR